MNRKTIRNENETELSSKEFGCAEIKSDEREITLSKSQFEICQKVIEAMREDSLILVKVPCGYGCSTIVNYLERQLNAAALRASDFLSSCFNIHPLGLYQSILSLILKTIEQNEIVIIDDFYLVEDVFTSHYPTAGLVALMSEALKHSRNKNRSIVLLNSLQIVGPRITLKEFALADYKYFFNFFLGKSLAASLDVEKIYESVSFLDAEQIQKACIELTTKNQISTDAALEYLIKKGLLSNVNRERVEQVQLSDIKGIDDIIDTLERHVIFPINHTKLSNTFKFQPARGIVLYGPPGTGKTSIGRALAHRLGGKFFIIDGTFIANSQHFIQEVEHIFCEAKNNAPSIVFIDDFDTLFEVGRREDLYRFLLSELDGIENNQRGQVCTILTVMDVEKLPKALLRSGRLELWLEVPLPNEQVRYEILASRMKKIPGPLCNVNLNTLAEATKDFTGADLRSVIEKAKRLYGFDHVSGQNILTPDQYFHNAISSLIEQKRKSHDLSIGFVNEAQTRDSKIKIAGF